MNRSSAGSPLKENVCRLSLGISIVKRRPRGSEGISDCYRTVHSQSPNVERLVAHVQGGGVPAGFNVPKNGRVGGVIHAVRASFVQHINGPSPTRLHRHDEKPRAVHLQVNRLRRGVPMASNKRFR